MKQQLISFTNFCKKVLCLNLLPAQLVIAKIAFDKLQYNDLDDEEKLICRKLFGNSFIDGFIIQESARSALVLRLGRRSGKTILSAAYALYRMVTADLSCAGPGDKPVFMIVAPVSELSNIALTMAQGLVEQSNYLINYVVTNKNNLLSIKRPTDDRIVDLMMVNKSKGGTNLRGKSIIDLLIDESEFMPSVAEGKKITDKDIIDGASAAIIPDGKTILISTPYPTNSYTAQLFDKNYNKPKSALVALGSTFDMRGCVKGVPEMIERERERDPVNAMREYDCISTNAVGGFFDCLLIDEAISYTPIEYDPASTTSAGIDLGFSHDCSAEVIVQRQNDKIVILSLTLLTPTPKQPLKPSEVMNSFASTANGYNCNVLSADNHYYHTALEYAALRGIQLVSGPKVIEPLFIYLKDLLVEHKIVIPNDPELIKQLKSVLYKQKNNNAGIQIILPSGSMAGHTDLISALVQALSLDKRLGPISGNSNAYSGMLNKQANKFLVRPFQGFIGDGTIERW